MGSSPSASTIGKYKVNDKGETMKNSRPIGLATTLSEVANIPKDLWESVMTVEKSPLRNLDPRVAHMLFSILGFMWSAIFGIVIMESLTAFTISAIGHIALISGCVITYVVFKEAEKRPDELNKTISSFNLVKGYHTPSRGRSLYVNGKKVELDANDPGGEHE